MPEPTNPMAATRASVPALQAYSQSAAWVFGTAPIASATSVEVGFTAYGCDSDRTQIVRVNPGAFHGIARRLDRHGDHIFIQPGNGFLFDGASAFAACPDARYFLGGQTESGYICAIANDAHRLGGLQ